MANNNLARKKLTNPRNFALHRSFQNKAMRIEVLQYTENEFKDFSIKEIEGLQKSQSCQWLNPESFVGDTKEDGTDRAST